MGIAVEVGSIGKGVSHYWWTTLPDVLHPKIQATRTSTPSFPEVAVWFGRLGTGGAKVSGSGHWLLLQVRVSAFGGYSGKGALNEEAEVNEVAFFIEQPADPDEYLEESNPLYGRVPSWWDTPLWRRYREEAQLWVVNFDQLPLGHPTVKPTGGGTNMEGVRCLDGIKAVTKPPQWAALRVSWQPGRVDCARSSPMASGAGWEVLASSK